MNLNPLLCGMFFLSKFDLLCCSVCLLILVLPAIRWSRQTGFRRWWRMQTTTRELSDTKHKTQCIGRPKNDTDLVIQLTRTSNNILCLKYKTTQPKSDVVNAYYAYCIIAYYAYCIIAKISMRLHADCRAMVDVVQLSKLRQKYQSYQTASLKDVTCPLSDDSVTTQESWWLFIKVWQQSECIHVKLKLQTGPRR